ncbi:MAG: UbiA prenyltransferase family protein [Smithellaceae bacterium]
MKSYMDMLRVSHYTKNLFIFLPLFFALEMHDIHRLLALTLAFLAFSLLASAVYIFNDLLDIEEDRRHPRKKHRTLASGSISRQAAIIWMIVLLGLGGVTAWCLDYRMFLLCVAYIVLNIAYSLKLKHIAIVDILIVAAFFVIRIYVGGVIGEVPVYMWIVIMTFLLALFLALGKRRDDMLIFQQTSEMPRKSIDGYNLRFIDASMMIMAAVILVAYLMYTISPEIMAKFQTDKLYITAFFVLLGVLRYLQITLLDENSGHPADILLKDHLLQIAIVAWIVLFFLLVYL